MIWNPYARERPCRKDSLHPLGGGQERQPEGPGLPPKSSARNAPGPGSGGEVDPRWSLQRYRRLRDLREEELRFALGAEGAGVNPLGEKV